MRPDAIIDGALVAARHLQVGLLLVGDATAIEAELSRHPGADAVELRIVDAPSASRWPSRPRRRCAASRGRRFASRPRRSAMGDAAALFSAGHTGASVMAAMRAFGLLPGVDRPALATIIPTRRSPAVLLDSGASVECRPPHLRAVRRDGRRRTRGRPRARAPRVGLLSVGEEETKGNELTREAHRLLKAAPVRFVGNVEGRDVYSGEADVIVCDGFTGNVDVEGQRRPRRDRGGAARRRVVGHLRRRGSGSALAASVQTVPPPCRLLGVWRGAAARPRRPLRRRPRPLVGQGGAQRVVTANWQRRLWDRVVGCRFAVANQTANANPDPNPRTRTSTQLKYET